MRKVIFILLSIIYVSGISYSQDLNNPGLDYLTPADYNFPVRIYMWDVTGDDPFIDSKQTLKIGLAYNYSSAEKYFNTNGDATMVKQSFRQYDKGLDSGGYFRKSGALLWVQYNFGKVNKLVLRLPFTFTEINSYSSTTDVKPQPEFVKPRGPFQDIELSYTRNLLKTKNDFDIYGGAGFTFPTSRPKRYLDNPHGGNGDRWTANLNAYFNLKIKNLNLTTGGKYIYKFPTTNELFTPRPYGIGYPYLYDTSQISFTEMNDFINGNPYQATTKSANQFIFDFLVNYNFKFGLQPMLQFQYFNSSGDEFDTPVPVQFGRVNNLITPVNFITSLEGGYSGVLRIYLKQNFEKLTGSKFDFNLGFGTSVFGNNAQQEANLFFGITGYY
ncbi:MAG: hypothetical protein M3R36_08780 [Bacteroidota bacterium]|nr:hypothetical protein [Bacteroidota bacterium]